MTDPVHTCPTGPQRRQTAFADEPSGNLLWGALNFTVRVIGQAPMALVSAMQRIYDCALDAYENPPVFFPFRATTEAETSYECIQIGGKTSLFEYAVERDTCAANGCEIDRALVFLSSRLKMEHGQSTTSGIQRLTAVTLQGAQSSALALGLPLVGGILSVVNGLAEILTALSVRRTTRVDTPASQTVSRRAGLARIALERLRQRGTDATLIEALLLEARYEDKGVAYGKTPHSRMQASNRWDAIARRFPNGPPASVMPRVRREKYEEHTANTTAEEIQQAMILADRILAAIILNEKDARTREAGNETAALIRIAAGFTNMLLGVALIAFPSTVQPCLLAVLALHGLRQLWGRPIGPRQADESLIVDIMGLLQNRTASAALGRKFVKAVLRENGMDGIPLQALHFAEACQDDWDTAWANAYFRDQFQQPDLLEHARRVVNLQLRALLTGSSARDAITHGRNVQRQHYPEPYRRPAVDAFIEDVPDD